MSLPVAILAGGLATRMLPLTDTIPKSLIKIGDDYFISHQLHYLRQQGISQVVLCVGHLGEQIESLIGNGSTYGLKVQYSWDGPQLLGTGGALKHALPLLGQTFFVLYGDSYLPINFTEVAQRFYQSKKQALMTVFKNQNQWDKSNVSFSQNLILDYNKYQPKAGMDYIDYGLSIVSRSVFAPFSNSASFDLAELFHELSLRGQLAGYEVGERFYEIGSFAGLSETINKLATKATHQRPSGKE